MFTFYTNGLLKFKCPAPGPKDEAIFSRSPKKKEKGETTTDLKTWG